MSDKQLVTAILTGDTERFSEVVQRYLSIVRGVCASYEREPDLRDDLVQETFIDAYRNLNKLRDHSKLGAWVVQIARRRGASWARQQQRRSEVQQQLTREHTATVPSTPLAEATRNELRDWVLERVHGLPQKTREAILLYYFEGLSIRECAEYLKVSESSIKKRLQYGRHQLGDQLAEVIRDTGESNDEQERQIMGAIPFAAAPWLSDHTGVPAAELQLSSSVAWKVCALATVIVTVGALMLTKSMPMEEPESVISVHPAIASDLDTVKPSSESTDAQDAADEPETETIAVAPALLGDLEVRVRFEIRERVESGRVERREGPPVSNAAVTVVPVSITVPQKMLDALRREGIGEVELEAFLTQLREHRQGDSSPFQDSDLGKRIRALAKDTTLFPEPVRFEVADKSAAVESRSDENGIVHFDQIPTGLKRISVQIVTGDIGVSDNAGGNYVYVEAGEMARAEVLAEDKLSLVRGVATLNGDSSAVEGLSLQLVADGSEMGSFAQTKEDGSFVFPYAHLPHDTDYSVIIDDKRYYGDVFRGTTKVGKRVDIPLLVYRSGSISGTARYEDGQPVVGASIYKGGIGDTFSSGARTNSNGEYELFHEGGQFRVYANRLGAESNSIPLTLNRDESATHDFIFSDEPGTVFQLLPKTIQPLGEDTEVYLMRSRHERWQSATYDLGLQVQALHYSFIGPTDDYVFRWYARGFNPVEHRESLTSMSHNQLHTIEFTPATEQLDVVVFDVNDNLREDGEIALYEQITNRNGKTSYGPFHFYATVKRDGTASFEHLWPGTYEFMFKGYTVEEITVPFDGIVELHSKPQDASGTPNNPSEPKLYFTDRDDFFLSHYSAPEAPLSLDDARCLVATEQGLLYPCEMLQEAGRHELYWIKSGYTPGVVTLDLEENRMRTSNEIIHVEIEEGGTAFGIATDSAGAPLANAKLYVYPATTWNSLFMSEGMKFNSIGHILSQEARTNDDGSFEVPFLPEGQFYVAALAPRTEERSTVERRTAWFGPIEIRNAHDTGSISLILPD